MHAKTYKLILLFHLVCYYIVWLTCILSASRHHAWLGASTALGFTIVQYMLQIKINHSRYLLCLIAVFSILGFMIDSLFAVFNLMSFKSNPFHQHLSPPWMIGLWMNFSVILYVFIKDFFSRYFLLALLSLVGFPLAYFAGVSLGAASLPSGYIGLVIIGITWSVILPAVLYWYDKLLWSSTHA